MRDWFAKAFGRAADAFGHGMGDVADKLVFESFFQRPMPEREADAPGRSQDRPATAEQVKSALDRFYDRLSPAERAEHFREPPEQERGIDR